MQRATPLVLPATLAIACGGGAGGVPLTPAIAVAGHADPAVPVDPVPSAIALSIEEVIVLACDGARLPVLRRAHAELVRGELVVDERLTIPPDHYCGLEVVLAGCSDPEACPVVAAESIAVRGRRASDGAMIEARDETPGEIVLIGRFVLAADAGGLLLAVEHSTLVAGLEVSTLPLERDGTGRIDAMRNADRLPALREGLRAAMTLRRDANGNGRLDSAELSGEPLAAATAPP
jgi:hypothetical protein